jgi:hypothetical protein
MRKISKLFSVPFLVVLFLTAALAANAWGKNREIRDAMQAGGDRLVALQNADGGWFFVVGDADCGFGPGVSCPNTFGVTALGLSASFNTVHDQTHLDAALLTGDALLAKHAAAPPCDGNPATTADRPFTVDVTFLLDGLGRLAGNEKKAYRGVARAWFLCVMADFPSGADRADNRVNGRIAQGLNNLGAWDASLDIRAAVAVGERDYALAEARQVIVRQPDWDVADPQCPSCELLAKGLYLAATKTLQGARDIREARESWRDDLLAAQSPDGSWGGDTQITAYIVMGLEAMSEGQGTHEAIRRAVEFLLSMQLPNGGFAVGVGFPDEVTEVDGEVLQALAAH